MIQRVQYGSSVYRGSRRGTGCAREYGTAAAAQMAGVSRRALQAYLARDQLTARLEPWRRLAGTCTTLRSGRAYFGEPSRRVWPSRR